MNLLYIAKQGTVSFFLQVDIPSPSATKKNSSKSGGAKKAIGLLLRKEQFELRIGLLFFGAGGHVFISGIRNFFAFGVAHLSLSITSNPIPELLTGEVHAAAGVSSRFFNFFLQIDFLNFLVFLLQEGPIELAN